MAHQAFPEVQEGGVVRSDQVVQLADQVIVGNAPATVFTNSAVVAAFRRFTLYLRLKSTSNPTTLQIVPQFLEPRSGRWHDYSQGVFAALFYEDADLATEVDKCFDGDCHGREVRVKLVCTGGSATQYFTVSVAAEFRD